MIIPAGIIYHDCSAFAIDAYFKQQSEHLLELLDIHLQTLKLLGDSLEVGKEKNDNNKG